MPSTDTVIRVVSLCVVFGWRRDPARHRAHGAGRASVWQGARALRLSIVSGTLLAFTICWLLVPDIGLRGWGLHLALGAVLAAFMASFDILLGRFCCAAAGPKPSATSTPRTGNLLVSASRRFQACRRCGLAARINPAQRFQHHHRPAVAASGRLSSSARVTVFTALHVVGGGAVLPDGGAPTAGAEEAQGRRASRAVSEVIAPRYQLQAWRRASTMCSPGSPPRIAGFIPGRGYAADEVEAGCLTRAPSR